MNNKQIHHVLHSAVCILPREEQSVPDGGTRVNTTLVIWIEMWPELTWSLHRAWLLEAVLTSFSMTTGKNLNIAAYEEWLIPLRLIDWLSKKKKHSIKYIHKDLHVYAYLDSYACALVSLLFLRISVQNDDLKMGY